MEILLKIIQAIVPLIALFFTIYFSWQKIGTRVKLISHSVHGEQLAETRIDNIILLNRKNKPVLIKELIAIFPDRFYYEVKSDSLPILLKPLEAIIIRTKPFSTSKAFTIFNLRNRLEKKYTSLRIGTFNLV